MLLRKPEIIKDNIIWKIKKVLLYIFYIIYGKTFLLFTESGKSPDSIVDIRLTGKVVYVMEIKPLYKHYICIAIYTKLIGD